MSTPQDYSGGLLGRSLAGPWQIFGLAVLAATAIRYLDIKRAGQL